MCSDIELIQFAVVWLRTCTIFQIFWIKHIWVCLCITSWIYRQLQRTTISDEGCKPSLNKSSLLSTRNVGHLVLFLLFWLVLGTQWFHSLVVHLLLILFWHVWFPAIFCSLLTFISYSHPVFVIVVFVFLVPKITLVYIAFFFPISILKVFLCTLCFGLWCVLCPCPLDPLLGYYLLQVVMVHFYRRKT